MKRKVLSILLSLCMVLTMVPTAFAAEGEGGNDDTGTAVITNEVSAEESTTSEEGEADSEVAKIGDQSYNTLKEAFVAAQDGDTIELTADASLTEKITVNKSVTLNAGEHTITGVTGNADVYFEITGKTFTVSGGTFTAFGDTADTVTGAGVFKIPSTANNAKITVTDATVEKFNRAAFDVRDGEFDIKNCTINCDNGQTSRLTKAVVAGYDEKGTVSGTVTNCKITGSNSTYEGWSASGIEVSAGSTVTVENTSIESMKGGISVARNYGHDKANVIVNNCTIDANDFAMRIFESNNSDDPVENTSAQLTVNGGTYKGDVRVSIGDEKKADDKSVIEIKGGAFSGITTDGFEKFVGKGYLVDKTGEGAYQVVAASDAAASIETENGSTQYATLEAAVAAASKGQTVNLLKDVTLTQKLTISKAITLNGKNHTITGQADSTEVYIEITGGTFTISNAKLTGFGDTATTVTGYGVFKIPASAKDAKIVASDLAVDKFNRAAFDVRNGSFEIKDCTINCDNGQTDRLTKGIVAGYDSNGIVNGTVDQCIITGSNSTYEGWSASGIEISAGATVTVSNTTINSIKGGISVARNYGNGKADVTVENCDITAADYALRIFESNNTSNPVSNSSAELKVNGGNYSGDVRISLKDNGTLDGSSKISITGGYFTADPSAYVADGKIAVLSDKAGYAYMIVDKSEGAADVVVAAPNTTNEASDKYPEDSSEKALADAVDAALNTTVPELETGVLTVAANAVANKNAVTADEAKTALTNGGVTVGGDATVTVVIQPYMDIVIKNVSIKGDDKTFTLDITPMYKTVATTADVDQNGEIILKTENEKVQNAVEIGEARELEVNKPITVTIPLPSNFTTGMDDLYVIHKKDNGKTYVYTGKVSEVEADNGTPANAENTNAKILTFINPNGFSSFTVSTKDTAVARIGDIGYTSLQDAVDAVANNGEITVLEGDLSATVSGSSKTFTLKTNSSEGIKVTVNGKEYFITSEKEETVSYTRPSSGGGGSVTTYAVTVEDTDNGTVTASVKSASKGSTVTLTVKPDEGYQLDKLTVTDKDGKEISVTEKEDGKYTFTMPASKVSVSAAFTKSEEKPEQIAGFTDVLTTDWFADAVQYVVDNGMMNGTSETTFRPNGTTTRGMIVTILYRLEKEPAVDNGAGFADVAADQYYADAVAWASANDIVTGYSEEKFGPDDSITREQFAAILYRYAQYKKIDVTATADLSGYADAAQISAYAETAMKWANGEGLISSAIR